MMRFVHKKYLVKVMQLDDKATLKTVSGTCYGEKGDYLITDSYGNQAIIPKDHFEENYVAVIVLNKFPSKVDWSFAEEYIHQLKNYYNLEEKDEKPI